MERGEDYFLFTGGKENETFLACVRNKRNYFLTENVYKYHDFEHTFDERKNIFFFLIFFHF